MTAFAVYGVLFHECLSTAKKNTPASIKKGDKLIPLSQQEWLVEVEKRAEKQFKTAKPKKLSILFDAPQFCKEFIALSERHRSRDLHIRAAQKQEVTVKGKKVIRTTWLPIEQVSIQ